MHIIFNGHRAKIYGTDQATDLALAEMMSYEPDGAKYAAFGQKFIYSPGLGRMVYNKRYIPGWDPKVRLYDRRSKEFPAGLMTAVTNLYPDATLQCELNIPEMVEDIQIESLYDYQKEVVKSLLAHSNGMVEVPTGGGKTVCISEVCMRNKDLKVLITVPSLDLLFQTRDELSRFTGEKVGIYGDGEKDTSNRITVCTIQSLVHDIGIEKRSKRLVYDVADKGLVERLAWLHGTKMWIVDECHGAAAESYQIVSYMVPNAVRRYGFTATLRREDGAEMVMEGILGPSRLSISPSRLIDDGFLCKPRVELHMFDHKSYRVKGAKPAFSEVYNQAVTTNTERTEYIAFQVKKCLENEAGPVLVLFDRIDHGKSLYLALKAVSDSCVLINGDTKTDKRKEVKDKVATGEIDIVVASVIWVTGINIKRLRTVVVAGAGRSGIQTVQRAGRVLRTYEGKDEALIIDICDLESCYLQDQVYARRYHYNEKYPGYVYEVQPGPVIP